METNGNGASIDLRDVVKTYETGAGGVTVLREITLQVQPGEFVSVVSLIVCCTSNGLPRPVPYW